MGRRLNLAMPAMFVLFVFGLFYYTFGRDDDVVGRAGAARDDLTGAGRWATTADDVGIAPNVSSCARATAKGTAGPNDDAFWAGRPADFYSQRHLSEPELEVRAPNERHSAPVVMTVDSRIGVLMIACNRPEVQRALDSLLKYVPALRRRRAAGAADLFMAKAASFSITRARPSKRFPVVISQVRSSSVLRVPRCPPVTHGICDRPCLCMHVFSGLRRRPYGRCH